MGLVFTTTFVSIISFYVHSFQSFLTETKKQTPPILDDLYGLSFGQPSNSS